YRDVPRRTGLHTDARGSHGPEYRTHGLHPHQGTQALGGAPQSRTASAAAKTSRGARLFDGLTSPGRERGLTDGDAEGEPDLVVDRKVDPAGKAREGSLVRPRMKLRSLA